MNMLIPVLCLPTMVANRIFRHIPTDCPEFEVTAEKWNYLITMTAGIQKVISNAALMKPKAVILKKVFCIVKKIVSIRYSRNKRNDFND